MKISRKILQACFFAILAHAHLLAAPEGSKPNIIFILTDDNGPQLNTEGHGSAGPLRDGKWTNFEGGIRSPTIMRWPAVISAGSTNDEITSIMDLLPTFCEVAEVEPPADRVLDGRSILPYLEGKKLSAPIHDTFIVPGSTIRHGDWKLFVKRASPGGSKSDTVGKTDRKPTPAGSLFNLRDDIGETTDLSKQHPEKVTQLTNLMKTFQQELHQNKRPIGRITEVPADVRRRLEKSKKKNR